MSWDAWRDERANEYDDHKPYQELIYIGRPMVDGIKFCRRPGCPYCISEFNHGSPDVFWRAK